MKVGIFANKPFSIKAVFCLLLVLAGFCLTLFFTMIVWVIYNPESVLSGQIPELTVEMLRIAQTIQSFFVFIIPALFFAWLFSKNPNEYLYFEKNSKIVVIILVAVASIAVIPFINWLAYVNEQIKFPDVLKGVEQWMWKNETANRDAMEMLLQMDSPVTLLYNIFLIGALAAVSEELLFRGIIQRLIGDASKNIHIGIWTSAFIFSAIHFQFYGFFPRLLLGVWFGYLLWWSKSLWLPVLAHFVNNATAVVVSYMQQRGMVDSQADTMGKDDVMLSVISIVVFGVLIFVIYKIINVENKKTMPDN